MLVKIHRSEGFRAYMEAKNVQVFDMNSVEDKDEINLEYDKRIETQNRAQDKKDYLKLRDSLVGMLRILVSGEDVKDSYIVKFVFANDIISINAEHIPFGAFTTKS
jgi:hypothetical protein